jgi:hypothetical protein
MDDQPTTGGQDMLAMQLQRKDLSPDQCEAIFTAIRPTIEKVAKQKLWKWNACRSLARDAMNERDVLDVVATVFIKLREGKYDANCGSLENWSSTVIWRQLIDKYWETRRGAGQAGGDPDGLPSGDASDKSMVEVREDFEQVSGRLRKEMSDFARWYSRGKEQICFPAVLWLELRRRVGEALGNAYLGGSGDEFLVDYVPWLADENNWAIRQGWPTIGEIWLQVASRFRADIVILQIDWVCLLEDLLRRERLAAASGQEDCVAWTQWVCRGRKRLADFVQREGSVDQSILWKLIS